MKTIKLSLLAVGLLGVSNLTLACSTEEYMGSICTVAFDYCPEGSLPAEGQILQINQYNALFSLLSNRYGGDGKTTFALPDLRSRSVVGASTDSKNLPTDISKVISLGDKRGAETVKLSVAQLPPHTHTATFNQTGNNPITVNIPVSTDNGTTPIPTSTANRLAVANNGSDQIAMWTPNQTNPVNIGGVTASGGGSTGTVTNANTGDGQAVPTIPPQLGLKQCIVVSGVYPVRH